MKTNKAKISFLESAPSDPSVKGLQAMENYYSGLTKDITMKKMDYYPDIVRLKLLCLNMSSNVHINKPGLRK